MVVLEAGDVTAEVEPRHGSNLCSLRYRGQELLRCDRDLLAAGRWTGTPVLWPFPNRVRGKEYRFGGRTVSLAAVVRPEGNWPLIHGLVDDLPWEWEDAAGSGPAVRTWIDWLPAGSAASQLFALYPFPSRLTLEVEAGGDGVRVSYRVDNLGDEDLPFGFALHPYFALLDGGRSEVLVPADAVMEADDDLLPSGRLLPVDGEGGGCDLRRPVPAASLQLDHVFTRLRPGPGAPCLLRHPRRGFELVLRASGDFTHVVLYTMKAASEGFVCLENQTSSTDAVNLHTRAVESGDAALAEAAHLLVVPPGASHGGWIDYRVRPIAEDGGGAAGGTVSA